MPLKLVVWALVIGHLSILNCCVEEFLKNMNAVPEPVSAGLPKVSMPPVKTKYLMKNNTLAAFLCHVLGALQTRLSLEPRSRRMYR